MGNKLPGSAASTSGSEPQAQQAGQPTGGGSELRAHNSPPVVGSAASMDYDGTTAEARVVRCRFGYTINVHEHLLGYEIPAWRLTRRGAERKARRMLARWRRDAAAPDVVKVVR